MLLLSGLPAQATEGGRHPPFEVSGQVVKNHDGDTIKLRTVDRGTLTIRLSGADTPESGQAYWKAARGYLRSLVVGRQVHAWCYKQDRYDREVCHVRIGNQDVGEALIAGGYAWYAEMFAAELSPEQRDAYAHAQHEARTRRLGLWNQPDPMPPWECRKIRKAGQTCR